MHVAHAAVAPVVIAVAALTAARLRLKPTYWAALAELSALSALFVLAWASVLVTGAPQFARRLAAAFVLTFVLTRLATAPQESARHLVPCAALAAAQLDWNGDLLTGATCGLPLLLGQVALSGPRFRIVANLIALSLLAVGLAI